MNVSGRSGLATLPQFPAPHVLPSHPEHPRLTAVIEEYKAANGLREPKGPGLGYIYDFRGQPQRPPPGLPIAGCALARLQTGDYPERRARTSSKAIGSWWTDSLMQKLKDPPASTGGRGAKPACIGISTNSDYGSYWHDPELDERDPYMDKLRAENGAKRVLPVEQNSQFALESVPIADRLL